MNIIHIIHVYIDIANLDRMSMEGLEIICVQMFLTIDNYVS